MKVKELIQKLEKFDKEKDVVMIFASNIENNIEIKSDIEKIKNYNENIGIFPEVKIGGSPNYINLEVDNDCKRNYKK